MRRVTIGVVLLAVGATACGGGATKTVTVASAPAPSTSSQIASATTAAPVATTTPSASASTENIMQTTLSPAQIGDYNKIATRWDNAETQVNVTVKNKCSDLLSVGEYSAGLECLSAALSKWGPAPKAEIAELSRISKTIDRTAPCSDATFTVINSLKAYVRAKRALLHNLSNLQTHGSKVARLDSTLAAYTTDLVSFKSACAS